MRPWHLARAIPLVICAASCALPATTDRAGVGEAIAARSGADARGLPPPAREWTAPPGTSLADGVTLDEAVGIALWNNADFQLALASLGVARADLVEAGLIRNPIFSLLFPWGPKQLEFTATFAVDQLWQRGARVEDARLNAEAAAEGLVAHGLRLVGDVKLAFLDQISADRRVALAAGQSEVAAELVRIADARLKAGDISELDLRLVRADAVRLESARLARAAARDLAALQLRTLLGLDPLGPPVTLVEPAMSADGCPAAPPDLVKTALASRPDIRAAEMAVEAAGVRLGLERTRVVALTASLDANAEGKEGFELGPGLGLEIPVLSQNQGRKARAAADVEVAGRRYVALRASVAAEVGAALAGLEAARAAVRILGDDVGASLASARAQSEKLYAAGEISLLALLDTRQRLLDLEATRVDAQFGVNRAVARIEQAVGRSCAAR